MKEDRIHVCVRIRPYQAQQSTKTFLIQHTPTHIRAKQSDRQQQQELQFGYDHVLPPEATQAQVYKQIGAPVVEGALEGINGTIFAYGQTSSGKTYTCIGPNCTDPQHKGLLPRCLDELFDRIGHSPNYLEFRIKVSMVEIYMEKIRDLLEPSKTDLRIRENKTKGVYMQDVTQEYVASAEEAISLFQRGVANRAVASTQMNEHSSRSHLAFLLTLHQHNLRDGTARSGKVTLIDLAGSEKVSKTQAQGRLLDEAKTINKSLSSLGNVINALTDPKVSHVPYRDSKLTRLLQESLGGNSRTFLVINISPSAYNAQESISSLRFGHRAKDIKNKPKVNKEYTIPQLLLLLQKSQHRNKQLQLLLAQLTAQQSAKPPKPKAYQENLLDSDNPMMSDIEDHPPPVATVPPSVSALRRAYQSEIESDEEDLGTHSNIKPKGRKNNEGEMEEAREEGRVLRQELQRVEGERVQAVRQLDICQQRLDCVLKEARLGAMKLNAEKKESETMLQKYIQEQIASQEKEEKIEQLNLELQQHKRQFEQLSQLQAELTRQGHHHGINQAALKQSQIIISEALVSQGPLQPPPAPQSQKIQEELHLTKKELTEAKRELALMSHLEKAKEDLVSQKLSFVEERARVYRDLQNRIDKVLELQERLDEEKDKRRYFQQLVRSDPSAQKSKLHSVTQQLTMMSEEYYVLKGQQSSWKKNNKKLEERLGDKTKEVHSLHTDILQMKAEIEFLRMKCQEYDIMNENQSVLDEPYLQGEEELPNGGNIVKVLRPTDFTSQNNEVGVMGWHDTDCNGWCPWIRKTTIISQSCFGTFNSESRQTIGAQMSNGFRNFD